MLTLAVLKFLTIGAVFGLTNGLSPGPLTTLVISETLKHNKKEGIKIALAPLITDLPIILITLFVVSRIARYNTVLSIISFMGGIFIAYLGYKTFTTKEINIEEGNPATGSLKKGIIVNFLNPSPYLFWLTVGTSTVVNAKEEGMLAVVLFFISFYVMLIGSKIGIAFIVEYSRSLLNNRGYILTMRILGTALFVFAIMFIYDGIKLLPLFNCI